DIHHEHAALGHSHDHGGDSSSEHEIPAATIAVSNHVGYLHMHISVLGIDVTVPVSPGPNESNGDSGEHTVVIAGLVGDSMPPAQVRTAFDLGLVDARLDYHGPALPFAPRFSCTPAIAAPLCDIARHERSGVQLI
ncbi:MAG: hypothetical protein HY000_09475, partial [Planctomycetes bacterium]|nr:hypothetical protein [Planctomycetota bacterium]